MKLLEKQLEGWRDECMDQARADRKVLNRLSHKDFERCKVLVADMNEQVALARMYNRRLVRYRKARKKLA